MNKVIGTLKQVDLREYWENEATDFTPWLAKDENIAQLGKAVDIDLEIKAQEQSVRKLKKNLRNAGNIGSESSAADNAFMYSVIDSCKLNDIDPGRYISFLLNKLETSHEGDGLTSLLPCYYGL